MTEAWEKGHHWASEMFPGLAGRAAEMDSTSVGTNNVHTFRFEGSTAHQESGHIRWLAVSSHVAPVTELL